MGSGFGFSASVLSFLRGVETAPISARPTDRRFPIICGALLSLGNLFQ